MCVCVCVISMRLSQAGPSHGPLSGTGHKLPPQWGEITVLTGWRKRLGTGTTGGSLLLQLLHLLLPALSLQLLPLLPLGEVIRELRLLRGVPVIQNPLRNLVALVSFVGGSAGRVREQVRLRMLIGPEFLLSSFQHLGGFHHVLLILMLIEASSQHAGVEAVFISETTRNKTNKLNNTTCCDERN